MTDHTDLDALLRQALAVEDPSPALLRQAKASMRKEQTMHTDHMTKRVVTLALAAALLLALSVTAYAVLGPGDWFKDFFAGLTGETLTEGQQAYIDGAATPIGQSVTADGWTLTLQSAMTDGKRVYMKLDIRSEDGAAAVRNPVAQGRLTSAAPDAPGDLFLGSAASYPEGETDGVFTQVMEKSVLARLGEDPDFSQPLTLTVYRLEDVYGEDRDLLGEGPWEFTFTLAPAEDGPAELIAEPIVCHARYAHMTLDGAPYDPAKDPTTPAPDGSPVEVPVETWYEDVDVTVTSLRLYSTGAVITYTYDGEDPQAGPDLGHDLTVELAGGGTAQIAASNGTWNEALQARVLDIAFAVPIDLDEVTAVTFQGHALALPG